MTTQQNGAPRIVGPFPWPEPRMSGGAAGEVAAVSRAVVRAHPSLPVPRSAAPARA